MAIYPYNNTTSTVPLSTDDMLDLPTILHVFSTFIEIPIIYTESGIQALLAMDNKNDTLKQSQMSKASDSTTFIASQIPEIRGLEKMDVFQYLPISALPSEARLLSSIWSYRRKRKPNGDLVKHKVRICVNGSQQDQGRDYWDTYAPVVSWSTIHLVLLLASIANLQSHQVDYTQAFPQADLLDPVYMCLPQGWHISPTGALEPHPDPKNNDKTHYIKLKKNLYGCKQATRNWFQHLDHGLQTRGFCQSKIDPCLYMRDNCIMVIYTDDCLIFAPSQAIINEIVSSLSATYLLEDQGDVHDYLGIRIIKDPVTTMSQTGLINSILQDLGLSASSNTKNTPSNAILHVDSRGLPRQDTWNY
jgi:hypothetical protein